MWIQKEIEFLKNQQLLLDAQMFSSIIFILLGIKKRTIHHFTDGLIIGNKMKFQTILGH